jgi:hypothetical protein
MWDEQRRDRLAVRPQLTRRVGHRLAGPTAPRASTASSFGM